VYTVFLETLQISLSVDNSFITAFKYVGAGSATIAMAGAGVGIGIIFASLIVAYVRGPKHKKQILNFAMFGFALTEAIALFGLMMAFIILFN